MGSGIKIPQLSRSTSDPSGACVLFRLLELSHRWVSSSYPSLELASPPLFSCLSYLTYSIFPAAADISFPTQMSLLLLLLSHMQLFCDPSDHNPSGSSVHRLSQARILEWIAISFSRGSSPLRDQTRISCVGRWILYHRATREAHPKKLPLLKSLSQSLLLGRLKKNTHRSKQKRNVS